MALAITQIPTYYNPRVFISGNVGNVDYRWRVRDTDLNSYPYFRETLNTTNDSDTAEMPNPDDFYTTEPDGFYYIQIEVNDDVDTIIETFALPKVPLTAEELPTFDPNTISDGDMLYFVLEPEVQTQAEFRTEADTDDARTSTESLGVQFVDQSVAGDVDGVFLLQDGTVTYDAEFEFEL